MRDTKTIAVPLDFANEKRIVNAELGDVKIAVFADKDLGLFGAVVVPEGLVLKAVEGRMLIAEDGRMWSAIDGTGKDGDLDMLPTVRSFWFAWGDHYPETGLVKD